jgi:hypothetical protein
VSTPVVFQSKIILVDVASEFEKKSIRNSRIIIIKIRNQASHARTNSGKISIW